MTAGKSLSIEYGQHGVSTRGMAGSRTGKRVLDVGSGVGTKAKSHPAFKDWQVVRLDIDTDVKPDLVGSAVDMRGVVDSQSFDGIWCSHQLEHLDDHEVFPTLKEFHRVLRSTGFALITSPDLEAIAHLVLQGRLDEPAYHSMAGPISPLDMLFGHRASVASGHKHMAHRTGFSKARLGQMLARAGFSEVWTAKGQNFDLWAVGLMAAADRSAILRSVSSSASQYLPVSFVPYG